jgi:LacI family transcriptional regulator
MKRPTQNDVAKIAGVSRATVSLVVNGQTDGRVPISEETRQRVLEAINELGYEPDASARALRSGDTKTIGLVIPDVRNPHFWDNVCGVEQAAREAGYHLLLSSLGQQNQYGDDTFRDLLGQRIDGLVLMGSFIDQSDLAAKTLLLLRNRHLAIVEVSDRSARDHHVDSVVSDYKAATQEVIAYLFSLNHRRIGFIFGVDIPQPGMDRLVPYRESLKAASLPADEDLVIHCGPEIEDGYQAARQLLRLPQRPTAIIAINDLLAIGAARAAADAGLRIPEDLSLVGYDDIFASKYLVPRLTTVSKDAQAMGRAAVRLVLERIHDHNRPQHKVEFTAQVIIRESTGPAPV